MTKRDFGLGRIPAPDTRDMQYLLRRALPPPKFLSQHTNWRTGPVLDQGSTSSCVGHAWRAFMESSPIRTKTGMNQFEIYQEARKVDEWPGEDYDGTSVRAGAKVLMTRGHLEQYLWAFSADDIAAWLLNRRGGGPVIMGTTWYEGMFYPDAEGRVRLTGSTVGGHAWLIYGYNARTKLFRAQNSWGREWGRKGRFTIHRDDLQTLVADYGEACTAVEKALLPTPIKTLPGQEPQRQDQQPEGRQQA